MSASGLDHAGNAAGAPESCAMTSVISREGATARLGKARRRKPHGTHPVETTGSRRRGRAGDLDQAASAVRVGGRQYQGRSW
jgi:hypothetical protein